MISLSLPIAHGLLIGRQDLPIPAWLFAWGASVVLIVSFVALSVAWRDSKFSSDHWHPVSERLSRPVTALATQIVTGAIGVFLLGVVVYTGLRGTDEPNLNFAVTFVFVTFWLGMVLLSILLGDVFRAFNPWRAIARAVGAVFRLVAGQARPAPLRYPERLGRWPAVVGIVAFVWLELVYGTSGFQAVGLQPTTVAIATLAYTAYTLLAMLLFGVETWLERGETLLRLLRDVLPAGSARGTRGTARDPPPAGGGDPLGRCDSRIHRARRRDDRQHHVRRRPGGAVAVADPQPVQPPHRHRARADHRLQDLGVDLLRHHARRGGGDLLGGRARDADSARLAVARDRWAPASPTP